MVFQPHLNLLPTGVSHYYGDIVRQVFVAASAVMLVASPFYADSLKSEIPFYVAGALVLIILAALTNPHNRSVLLADAVAAGVGVAIFEVWALGSYETSTWVEFLLRQGIALLFLVAFYFSMKTVRAFSMHQIGKWAAPGEFDEEQKPNARPSSGAAHVEATEDSNAVDFTTHPESPDSGLDADAEDGAVPHRRV